MEPLIIDTEVVAKFVKDRAPHLLADLVVVPAEALDGLLVDADLVGRDEVVVLAAVSKRDAVVKPEKRAAVADPRRLEISRRGPPFDNDINIVDAREQLWRK